MSAHVFEATEVSFRYPGAPGDAVTDLTLRIPRGELCAVIGPNGSGKSTLGRLLLGVHAPHAGSVCYEGRPIASWPSAARARQIGVVAQHEEFAFPLTVRELVTMGRYPHLGPWRALRQSDAAAIRDALAACEVSDLADRQLATLSGGELQRARLARALAQQPAVLVLDEPTASLDIAYEMGFFELLRALRRNRQTTVLVVTHNINLAARYADRIVLLADGRIAADGSPARVIDRATIERAYGWPVAITLHPGPGSDTGAPQVAPLSRTFNSRTEES